MARNLGHRAIPVAHMVWDCYRTWVVKLGSPTAYYEMKARSAATEHNVQAEVIFDCSLEVAVK